jgi:heme-degrading monooxygenase HmoA
MKIAKTGATPYYAVIFTSLLHKESEEYSKMADEMEKLAIEQDGYLGHESARGEVGITVSYWRDLESIKNWKKNSKHLLAQKIGREKFYSAYKTRICLVERDYEF